MRIYKTVKGSSTQTMLRDTLLCREAISGMLRKVWRHTKFTKFVKRSKIVYHCVAKLEVQF